MLTNHMYDRLLNEHGKCQFRFGVVSNCHISIQLTSMMRTVLWEIMQTPANICEDLETLEVSLGKYYFVWSVFAKVCAIVASIDLNRFCCAAVLRDALLLYVNI